MKLLSTIKGAFSPTLAKGLCAVAGVCATVVLLYPHPSQPTIEAAADVSSPAETMAPPSPVLATVATDLGSAKSEPLIPLTLPAPPVVEAPPQKIRKAKMARRSPARPTVEVKPRRPVTAAAPTVVKYVPYVSPEASQLQRLFEFLAEDEMTPRVAKRLRKIDRMAKLDRLANAGLEETALLGDYSPDRASSTMDDEESVPVELVQRNALLFAEFQLNDAKEAREQLARWKKELPQLVLSAPPAPSPVVPEARSVAVTEPLMESDIPAEKPTAEEKPSYKANDDVEVAEEKGEEEEPTLVAVPAKPPVLASPASSAQPLFEMLAPASPAPTRSTPRLALNSQSGAPTQNSQPAVVTPAPQPEITVADNRPEARSGQETLQGLRTEEDAPFIDGNQEGDPEIIYGHFSVDDEMERELAEKKGHVQLRLVPIDRTDKQRGDTKFLDYSYRSAKYGNDFEIPAGTLFGNYRLWARIFVGQTVANIPLPREVITPYTRAPIKFHIKKRQYDHYFQYVANMPARNLFLNLSVFEGGQGNPKEPKRIKNAKIDVVAFPEWGTFITDKDGNTRLAKIPSRSELLVRVSAEGYYPTERVIPVFNDNPYTVLYLIPRDVVQSVTEFFTRKPQKTGRAVVMGRVFNSDSRKPQAGEQVQLQFRNGPAVYSNVFPDIRAIATAITGLFSFYNAESAIRWVSRAVFGKWASVIDMRPDSGYFVEFGRGGKKNIRGHLYDTLNGIQPEARLRMIGQRSEDYETDGRGGFVFENVDLQSGIVPIEVESRDHPKMLYSVAFNTEEKEEETKLFLLDQKMLKDSHQELGKISQLNRETGSVIGGAESSLFERRNSRVKVSLFRARDQVQVPSDHGPTSWGRPDDNPQDFHLTRSNPRYAYWQLPPGLYVERLDEVFTDKDGKTRLEPLRAHVFFVGKDRVSMVIN